MLRVDHSPCDVLHRKGDFGPIRRHVAQPRRRRPVLGNLSTAHPPIVSSAADTPVMAVFRGGALRLLLSPPQLPPRGSANRAGARRGSASGWRLALSNSFGNSWAPDRTSALVQPLIDENPCALGIHRIPCPVPTPHHAAVQDGQGFCLVSLSLSLLDPAMMHSICRRRATAMFTSSAMYSWAAARASAMAPPPLRRNADGGNTSGVHCGLFHRLLELGLPRDGRMLCAVHGLA